MKNFIKLFVLLCFLPTYMFSQVNNFRFEKATSFFPEEKRINQEDVKWGYLIVPENWDNPKGKTIKIAVAIVKKESKNSDSNPVVYIPGGPGAGGIEEISGWLKHPLRKDSDIVLLDVRGTGFSFPRLCPDLGKKFLEILAKNQNSTEDEREKSVAAMACKQDLIDRNIDTKAYNSKSISKDLNALKEVLGYDNWNVYSMSYGTYTAQVYANDYPQDIKALILDSSISDISQYYNHNTSNYMRSLKKVFDACENDIVCNKKYPNLENLYYNTITKLDKNPITVDIDNKVIGSGKFTYNVEDFKIAIQQSLYNKKLIEVLPLLITEFNKGNKGTLSSLVASFSRALGLDYGVYYSVSCNEAIPFNSISEFDKNAYNFNKLKGGLSFYRSDFSVCNNWNFGVDQPRVANELFQLSKLASQVLVFSGAFDPITPPSNGKVTVGKFKNRFLVNAPIYGHAPSFSKIGAKIVTEFIKNPNRKPDCKGFQFNNKINFATDIRIKRGVSNMANSINEFNLLFFAPFFIALIISLISIFNFSYTLVRNRKDTIQNKFIKRLILITSFLGLFSIVGLILAIATTAQNNFYILAFGLPNKFDYLFVVQWIFIVFTIISVFYFVLKIKFISNRSIIATILFSLLFIGVYFQYWGFLF
jgi:pimeloyl-ACP methyl ester carboxylesterase